MNLSKSQIKRIDKTGGFDNSDFINIRLTKVKFNGKFTHWSVDLGSTGAEIGLEGTSPTIWGVLDMASEYIWDQSVDNEWFKDDANNQN